MTHESPSSATSSDTIPQNITDPATGMASARAVIGPRSVISLSTIEANYLAIKAFAPGAETAAVVKADAYGHGIAETSARLRQAGCNTFFVAYPHEGEALRNVIGGAPDVYVFNGVTKDTLSVFAAARLSPVCNHPDEISIWLKSELATWATPSTSIPA